MFFLLHCFHQIRVKHALSCYVKNACGDWIEKRVGSALTRATFVLCYVIFDNMQFYVISHPTN